MVASTPEDTGPNVAEEDGFILDRPWSAVKAARWLIAGEAEECTAVLLVGRGNRMIAAAVVARGWAQAARLNCRRVLELMTECGASGLVVVGSRHDSDTVPYPSEQRMVAILQRLTESAGVQLLDHVIVGHDGAYWSAMEESGRD